jgi:hypothetical protein
MSSFSASNLHPSDLSHMIEHALHRKTGRLAAVVAASTRLFPRVWPRDGALGLPMSGEQAMDCHTNVHIKDVSLLEYLVKLSLQELS